MELSFIKKIRKNKKGQMFQIILFFVAIFAIGLTILLGKLVLSQFYTAFDEAGLNTDATTEAETAMISSYAAFDYGLVVFSVMLIIGLVITSFLIPSHPIFVVINILGIFVLVFIGMLLTNIYGEIVAGEDAVLGDEADEFDLINFLISKLPFIGAIVVMITSVVMFARGSRP